MDDIAAKKVAELWLNNQPERQRLKIFRISMLLCVIGCITFCITYAYAGRAEILPWIIYPYLVPTILALALSYTHFSERVVLATYLYLITINIATRLLAEPAYLIDAITFAAFVAGCYTLLRPKTALALTIYHFLGLCTAIILVYFFHPVPTLYHNSEGVHGFAVAAVTSSIVVWVMSHLQSRNAEKYFTELREKVLEILQLNQDQHLLLGVVLHDFSNDLMRAMMISERLRESSQDSDMGKRLDLALNSMGDLIAQLKRLRQGGGLGVDATGDPVRIGDVLDRARLGFRDLLKNCRVTLQVTGDVEATVAVPLIILSASIVNNLLSNAIKFSTPGQVVRVSVRRRDHAVAMTIVNVGPTTDSEGFRTAFDGGNPKSVVEHSERGLGLGLRIAVRFSERMGIKIWGEQVTLSESQVTTTVHLEIPVA